MKDIVTTEFMKGLVDDLNLDIEPDKMDNLMKEAGLGKEEEKKEEEKKEEEDPKEKEKKQGEKKE